MATHTPPSSPRVSLPRALHDFVVEMAIAVHKRSFYPPGHPILQGAVETVHARLADLLQAHRELSIGVAERRVVIDGAASDEDHPLLAEFATRLGDHQIGAVRLTPGITRDELDAFLGAVAGPVDEEGDPLGRRASATTAHVAVHPIAFERLGLLAGQSRDTPSEHEDATWRALAAAALRGEGVGGDALDPHIIAAAIGSGSGDDDFDAAVIERLAKMLEELGARGTAVPAAQRQRVSDLVANIGEQGLSRLLQAGGSERGTQVVRTANDTLAARAVLELVRAASSTEAVSVSGAMLRLLQKLSTQSQAPGGRESEKVLRMSIHRLLDGWALQNPNPEMYERVLDDAANNTTRKFTDLRRDIAEPERVIDIALESQTLGGAAETALGRLAMRDGLAPTLERLQAYAASPVREALVDRLLNEASLREYLGQPVLDLPLLRQAVDRIKGRAIEPLLVALERRSDSDASAIAELLARIGWDVLEPLGAVLPNAPARLLRHLIALFDRLDAWPPQADPQQYASHPDVVVRREAIKYLLRSDSTRDPAVLAALRDREVRIFSLGLSAVARHCSPSAARILIARYADPDLTQDLRVRLIRAVGSAETGEAQAWLGGLLITRRWLFGSPRLRKASAETVAAAAAIVTHFAGSPLAVQVTELTGSSRVPEYRRAITRTSRGSA